MILSALCHLGRDAEVRATPTGTQVVNLALAYNVGFGDRKKTQWLRATYWGDRAAKLAPHLVKGTKLLIHADDVVIETFTKQDGSEVVSLNCRIVDIEFAGSKQEGAQHQPAQQSAPQQQQQAAPQAGGFDEFEEDPLIPF